MSADTLDPARLREHVAEVKAAWRKHAQALSWEQKVAAIERMRARAALLRTAREAGEDRQRQEKAREGRR
ncbi:MAG: hypothetical protein ACREU7_06325 [Burkholderiales bacterium]